MKSSPTLIKNENRLSTSEKQALISTYHEVMTIVKSERLVSERKIKIENIGYNVETRPMGSGGVGQIAVMQNEIRIQIGYGETRHNYALVVIISR